MAITPFHVEIAPSLLEDLRQRLGATRWPPFLDDPGWDYGTDPAWLRELVAYWRDGFDWGAQQARINAFPHFCDAAADRLNLHFIHQRGRGPQPLPLLLAHGWPDSFLRMLPLIPLLSDPAAHGGDAADAFDVVVPSLPGFGFSEAPRSRALGSVEVVDLLARLMTRSLGYERFGVHGGDLGSGVAELLARRHAASLVGIHLTDVPYWHLFNVPPGELSEEERRYLETGKRWQMEEGAYALMQATKPLTPAYALNDSPAGLAAWICEKFQRWSDCGGDIERRFSKDELLTHVTLYWATQTIGTSFLPYYASAHAGPMGDLSARVAVPTGVAIFPKDIVPAPRAYGERVFNVQRWSDMPRGGHFAALEEPGLLAQELREFFRPLRGG